MSVDETLQERGERYGKFEQVALTSQALRACLVNTPQWPKMNNIQREALTVICQKMSRIVNGDPNYADSWHDIAGYATLVENSLTS